MVKIRQVDVTMLDKPRPTRSAPRELSPRAKERLAQERKFKSMLGKLTDPNAAFEVRFDADDKPLTVRQRLLRAAQENGKEIVVRKSERGWLVALATPERRSRRGRRRASPSAG
jgi:hypothetical protein